jgi:hypothetical protein
VAHADMAEGIEHAFVRQHAIGERDLIADVGKIIGHWAFPAGSMAGVAAGGRAKPN